MEEALQVINWRVFMQLNRKKLCSERGLTLLEVLLALLISGIFLMMTLRLLTNQWRAARSLKSNLEAHYAVMTSGKTVSDAIRMAQTIEWVKDIGVLKVLPMPDETNPVPALDSYFLEDLDGNGIKDLYWKHLDVSQPVASYLTRWECVEVEPGLWEVFLEANVDGQIVTWKGEVRRRTYSPASLIRIERRAMSAFSS